MRREPIKGALSLEEARQRGCGGHVYRGLCYVIAAQLGGHYVSSTKPRSRRLDGAVVATFTREGLEVVS